MMMRLSVLSPRHTVIKRCHNVSATRSSTLSALVRASREEKKKKPTNYSNDDAPEKSARRRKAYAHDSLEATFGRHIIRSILRECSYLPDTFAADYIRKHALNRFRVNEFKAWKDRRQFEDESLDKTRRKEARSAIWTLKRANDGQRDSLLKVLHTAYARIGKRRHELMKPLLYVEGQKDLLSAAAMAEKEGELIEESTSDVTDNQAVTEPLPEAESDGLLEEEVASDVTDETPIGEPSPAFKKLTPKTPLDLSPPLRALLISQIRAKPPDTVRTNPRTLNPKIPELNSWHKPMPQNRIRNLRHKHYAMLLDRLQVPLPFEEWERLRRLAVGTTSPNLPTRTRRHKTVPLEGGAWVRKLDSKPTSALELVGRYGRLQASALSDPRAMKNHARRMQRLYAEVFRQCPLLEWDPEKEEWVVTWGFQALLLEQHVPSESARERAAQSVDQVVLRGGSRVEVNV